MEFKDQYDLQTALKIAKHPTVDSKIWAEAIEWLLLYGPPEIQQMLLSASHSATATEFPDLKPSGYSTDGQPFYNVSDIASQLGISEEEAKTIIEQKEQLHKLKHLASNQEATKIQ